MKFKWPLNLLSWLALNGGELTGWADWLYTGCKKKVVQSHLSPQKDELTILFQHRTSKPKPKSIQGAHISTKIDVLWKVMFWSESSGAVLEICWKPCEDTSGILSEYCARFPRSIQNLKQRVTRPMSDKEVLADLCYLCFWSNSNCFFIWFPKKCQGHNYSSNGGGEYIHALM